nr:fungal specific transcription factor domain [Aspergillus sp.]
MPATLPSQPAAASQETSLLEGHGANSASQGQASTAARSVVIDANVSIGGMSLAQMIITALHGHDRVKAEAMTTDCHVRTTQSMLLGEDLYNLPSNTSELLERFFSSRNILTPVFHVPTVRSTFNAAILCPTGQRHLHQPTFILLNMILALCTSHWMVVAEADAAMARRYYDIAMALLQPSLLRDWTLEHVQALIIGARYLQGSNCANESWNILGLAIRIAHGLRLHQDPPKSDPIPLQETKRRTWYAAYTLDMHFSMIYERPSAIRSADFTTRLPEDLDDDCIRDSGLLYPVPRPPSSSMTFFIRVIKLYQIVEDVLSRFSGDSLSGLKMVELVTTFDEAYQKWRQETPSHLVFDPKSLQQGTTPSIPEPPWILVLRGHMLRILIHRHSMAWTLRRLVRPQREEDSMVSHALQYSRKVCIASATETIDIVALRHEQTKQTMGLNWYNTYYLFNSAIILVSHIIDPAHSHDEHALAKVGQALRMMRAMASDHSFAQRAYSFLQQLLRIGTAEGITLDTSGSSISAQATQSTFPAEALARWGLEASPALPELGLTQEEFDRMDTQVNVNPRAFSEPMWPFTGQCFFDALS